MDDRAEYKYDRLLCERGKISLDDVLEQIKQVTREKCREVIALRRALLANATPQIVASGKALARAFAQGATLFALGHGASATEAEDLVTDLLNPPFPHWRPLPALVLNEHANSTAIGNDVDLKNTFVQQIMTFGRPGDIALAISSSDDASNLLAALAQAKRQYLLTIALAGHDGGQILHAQVVDFCLYVPSDHIPRIQEVQTTIYHTLLEIVHASIEPYEKNSADDCIALREKKMVR